MATQAPTKVVSIGSFPELLRRSRFASFDPSIRQTYGTPPSHLHRGNWGLKRPIAQRKRNAFISLKNFEEHEHYIEWNNAETQVRLIDKIEEINISPKLVPHVPWYTGLGPAAASNWSKMDTEFAPGETGMPNLPTSIPLFTTELEGLGLRGKGEYGMKAKNISEDGYLHPNVRSMSSKVFKRYLKKIRSLRPEFQKFLVENGVNPSFREAGFPPGNLHVRFLGEHFEKQFKDARRSEDAGVNEDDRAAPHPNSPQTIRQQPHRLGGLMYSSPTLLESYFNANKHPGLVLEDGSKTNFNNTSTSTSLLVSTAGIVGRLELKRAGPNVKPAFTSNGLAYSPASLMSRKTDAKKTGVNTIIDVKVIDLQLERLPVAVAHPAHHSINNAREVGIRMDLASHSSENHHWRTNTYPPGSMLYNVQEEPQLHLHTYFPNTKHLHTRDIYGTRTLKRNRPVVDMIRENREETKENGKKTDNTAALTTLENLQTNKLIDYGGQELRRKRNDGWRDDEWVDLNDKGKGKGMGQGNGTRNGY